MNVLRRVRKILLPSGKIIEIVYMDNNPCTDVAKGEPGSTLLNLHICRNCQGEMVYPLHYEEAVERHWQMTLRCPECEHTQSVIAPQRDADLFDEVLSDGEEALERDYKSLVTINMAEWIERFAQALESDGILPEDF